MFKWVSELFRDLGGFFRHAWRITTGHGDPKRRSDRKVLGLVILLGCTAVAVALFFVSRSSDIYFTPDLLFEIDDEALDDMSKPLRVEPKRFRRNTHVPRSMERTASGAVNAKVFFPDYDLMHIYDDRVWWESDHDKKDTEDDHIIHRAMEEPLRRLIELVDQRGAGLKVQDAYRPEGIHSRRSLHKEGRAIDVTAEGMSLEDLAKLCWAAGFDWVYYEAPKKGGHHVHCSVRADR